MCLLRNAMKVAALLLVYCSVTMATRCPTNCTCSFDKGGINCARLSVFPRFQEEPSIFVLFISDSNFPEIPPNAFANLTNILSISIDKVVVSKISKCAFQGLKNLTLISLNDANVGTIESGAFDDLSFKLRSSRLDMYDITIQNIEPFAFNNIHEVQFFGIFNANISRIMPFAFNNMTFRKMEIYRSSIGQLQSRSISNVNTTFHLSIYLMYIGELQCGTFDRLKDELGASFEYVGIDYICDCKLAWLLKAAENRTDMPLDKSRCRQSGNLYNRRLNTLNISEICEDFSETACALPSVSDPGSCLEKEDSVDDTLTTDGTVDDGVNTGVSFECSFAFYFLIASSIFFCFTEH